MKKISFLILIGFFIIFISACHTDTPSLSPDEFIGKTDEQLISAWGEGEVTGYESDGMYIILHRKYTQPVIGLEANIEFMLSSDQVVTQAVATFADADADDVISAMTRNIGDPVLVQEESDEYDFLVICEKNAITYTSRRIPDGGYYLLIDSSAQ